MILIGCLSIVSGVLVAALYHNDKTKPVPRWLYKILKCSPSSKALSSEHHVTTGIMNETNDQSMMSRNQNPTELVKKDKGSSDGISNGHEIPLVDYPDDDNKRVKDRKSVQNQLDNQDEDVNEWHKIAGVVDNMMFAIACVLTIGAIVITMTLFVMNSNQ